VPPGQHRVLRFTVTTPNIGTADVNLGDPNRHWDPNGDGDGSDSTGYTRTPRATVITLSQLRDVFAPVGGWLEDLGSR